MPVDFEREHGLGDGDDKPDDDDHPLHDVEEHILRNTTPVWVWIIVAFIVFVVIVICGAIAYRVYAQNDERPHSGYEPANNFFSNSDDHSGNHSEVTFDKGSPPSYGTWNDSWTMSQ